MGKWWEGGSVATQDECYRRTVAPIPFRGAGAKALAYCRFLERRLCHVAHVWKEEKGGKQMY